MNQQVNVKELFEDFLSDGHTVPKARTLVLRVIKDHLKVLTSKNLVVRPCPKCHIPAKYFRNSTCIVCDRARIKALNQRSKA